MAERLTDESLKALLSSEIHSSILYDRSELSEKRTRALEYYRGEMNDTPAAANRSSVVSRDVADTMGWMLPGIIRVFTASDRMAEYEPVGKGDEAFSEQATDYCNHIFWKDNQGYRILWNATHDSLLQGNGIIKHWWDDAEDCEYSEHTGMTPEQIALLEMDGAEIVAQKPGEPQKLVSLDETGQPVEQEIQTFDIKVKRITRSGTVRVECIKPEDFLLDRQATCIEDARFCAHRDEKTRSQLVEMGFDADLVENLPSYPNSGFSSEAIARDEEYNGLGMVGDHSMQLIELYECYVKADADGDGIAETIRAYYAGNGGAGELLDWEVWDDDVPFSDIPCEPVPHRWDARSVADETTDIQRIKTVLTRQFLDNLYWVNNPLMAAQIGTVENPEMMKAPVFGGTVWLNNKAQLPPQVLPVPFIGDKALLGLEHFDQVTEKRTGVSRSTMALDPETLQNQTATANQNQRDAAYSQIELIARNQAELGWRRVFKQILRLVVKHQDRPRVIRLRDTWVEMDPRFWNANMDATINVGLGTGSRDRDMAMLNNILNTQTGIAQQFATGGFMEEAIDMVPKIVKTATKLAESSGLRNPDEYYPDIDDQKLAQMKQAAAQRAQQPDPKVQIEQQKLGFEVEKSKVEMQMDAQKNEQDIMLQREKMQGELMLKREQLVAEMQLKREQLAAEMALKRDLSMQEMQIKSEMGMSTAQNSGAAGWLQKAIRLHEKHMNGSAPTDKASQSEMMMQMKNALSSLQGGSNPMGGMDMSSSQVRMGGEPG